MSLKLDFCDFKAAKFAVENWHYSKSMPAGKLVKIGVWENDKFIGAVIFGRGANNNLAKNFDLKQTECVELVRIALRGHEAPVSKILSIALKLFHNQSPNVKMVVSYADEANQRHKGTIYKASNWIFDSTRVYKHGYIIINGIRMHTKTAHSKWGSLHKIPYKWEYAGEQIKHRFLWVFEEEMRQKLKSKAASFHEAEGGAVPTLAHQMIRG